MSAAPAAEELADMPATEAEARADTARTDARCAMLVDALMLMGYVVHLIEVRGASAFLVGRWGRSIELPDLDALDAFLQRVKPRGGP